LAKKKVVHHPPTKDAPSAVPGASKPTQPAVSTGENLGGGNIEGFSDSTTLQSGAEDAPKIGNVGNINLDDMSGRLEDALKLLKGGETEGGGLNLNLCSLDEEVLSKHRVEEPEEEPLKHQSPALSPADDRLGVENNLPTIEEEEEDDLVADEVVELPLIPDVTKPAQEVVDSWDDVVVDDSKARAHEEEEYLHAAANKEANQEEEEEEEQEEEEEEEIQQEEAEVEPEKEEEVEPTAPAPKWMGWGKPSAPSALVGLASAGQKKTVVASKPAGNIVPSAARKVASDKVVVGGEKKEKKEEVEEPKARDAGKGKGGKGGDAPSRRDQKSYPPLPAWPSAPAWGPSAKSKSAPAVQPEELPPKQEATPAPNPVSTCWADEEEDEDQEPEVSNPMPTGPMTMADRLRQSGPGPQNTMRSQLFQQQQARIAEMRRKEAAAKMQQDAERQAVMRKKEEERQKEARDRRVAEAQERRQIQQQAAAPATTSNKPGAPAAPAPEPKRQKPKEVVTADGWGVVLSKKTQKDIVSSKVAPAFLADNNKEKKQKKEKAAPEPKEEQRVSVALSEEELKPYRNKVRNLQKKVKDIEALSDMKELSAEQQGKLATLAKIKTELQQAESALERLSK
jgi:hypothetical protein